MTQYKLIVFGGTFDLLHKGHKTFIREVLSHSEKVLLGITSDLYIKSFKDGNNIESFELRRNAVESFLESIGEKNKVQIVSINNAYEPYLETSIDYQAIAVTSQTKKIAIDINSIRKQNGVSQMDVVVIPMELADDGKEISSTRIRNGEINRDGRLYLNPQWENKNLILPENLRVEFQEPWGEVLSGVPQDVNGSTTIVVGDATAQKFNEKKVGQFLSIVDFLIHREVKFHKLSELGFDGEDAQGIKNPPSSITHDLLKAIQNSFSSTDKNRKVILVEGEEDLAVLPVVLVSPLGYSVFYGQPNQGIVKVYISEEIKDKIYNLARDLIIV